MLKTLFKREIKEVYGKRKFLWIAQGIIVGSPIPFYSSSKFLYSFNVPLFYEILYLNILYTGGFIFMCLPYLVEHFYRDRMRGNIEVLLALGFSPLKVWLTKILAVFMMNYPLYLFCGLVSLFINLILKSLLISEEKIFLYLFISPLFAFSIMGIKAFLHFFFQDIKLLNLFFVLPFVIFVILFNYSIKFFSLISFNISLFLIIAVFICFLIIFLLVIILKILPKENFVLK